MTRSDWVCGVMAGTELILFWVWDSWEILTYPWEINIGFKRNQAIGNGGSLHKVFDLPPCF